MVEVSIIVPVYNTGKYLKRCMDSLIHQTLENIEIICINDGSTDNSHEILEYYASKDERIKIINQANMGLSSARNRGIGSAIGEYIGFVDSDDWVDRDFFEKLYYAAKKYNADIAAASILQDDGVDSKTFVSLSSEAVFSSAEKKYKACNIPRRCYVWNKIYKRESYLNTKEEFPVGRNYEDIIWTHIVIHKLNRLVTVPKTYYYYNDDNLHSICKSFSKKNEDDLKIANKECMEYLRRNRIKVNYQSYSADRRILFIFFGIRLLDIKIWQHLILANFLGIPILQVRLK